MNRLLQLIIAVSGIGVICSCGGNHEHNQSDGNTAENHHHNGNEIVLPIDQAHALGIVADTLRLCDFTESLPVAAQILPAAQSRGTVTASTSGIVTLSKAAEEGTKVARGTVIATISGGAMSGGDAAQANLIALNAAQDEFDRVKTLFDAGLATRQELNAAETALSMARNASPAGKSVGASTAPIAGTVTSLLVNNGQFVEAGTPIAAISTLSELYVKADVPHRYSSAISPNVTATLISENGESVEARLKSIDMSGSEIPGYFTVYFIVDNAEGLYPGAYVEAQLSVKAGRNTISVPKNAVLDRLGKKYVYVKADDNCYLKRFVTIGASNANEYEITSGLNEGEIVVTDGSQFLRMAETASNTPEGHSHHH